ncbi:hypothetical protein GCM10010260_58490 [Streptomyces filipinensis]|uniref:Tetratricopeptide repeat protein n=1 Tax=Streptomyces filipinensis TaxID=66887 RepID=A0A918IHP4_9ACTN|nr:hypothetical protein GCM10010260_58490 [Streptomyces filipinensis]
MLGEDNPHTLRTRNNLAFAHQSAGDLGQAIPLFKQTNEDIVRVLGDSHPATRAVAANLAAVLGARGTGGPTFKK